MTILEFVGTCRKHDQMQTVYIKGRPTENNLDAGFTRLTQLMKCSDFSKVYSDKHVPNDTVLPHLYTPLRTKQP